jgi:hypothetical protein
MAYGCVHIRTSHDSRNPGTGPSPCAADERGRYCDSDTFLIRASAHPKAGTLAVEERKTAARNAAVLKAQQGIMEYYAGRRVETWSPMHTPPEEHIRGRKLWNDDLVRIVKSGRVVSEKYGNEQQCTILFAIYKKGLARWADIPFVEYRGGHMVGP